MAKDTLDCCVCKESKPIEAFYKRNNCTRGRHYECKECLSTKRRATYLKDPKKFRERSKWTQLKSKYGITKEQYQTLFYHQYGSCLICASDGDLAVDHCHDTGEIRGLICRPCNTGIGMLQDNPTLVSAAARYISH